jgi:hypothetical protein
MPAEIRPRPILRVSLLAVVAAAIAATVVGVRSLSNGDGDAIDQAGYAPAFVLTGVAPGAPVGSLDDGFVPPAAPADERTAVIRFFDAEIAGDATASFGLLSAADRDAIGSLENWEVGAPARPLYLDAELVDVVEGRARVEAELEPRVSEIDGVVPSNAVIELDVVAEDGGYRVSLANSTFTPRRPNVDLADDVARNWVDAAIACDDGRRTDLEYEGNLLGTAGLPDQLCGSESSPSVATSGSLELLLDPAPILNAFGEPAAEWSRVVRIDGTGVAPSVYVVLAPYGERWVVVGGLAG